MYSDVQYLGKDMLPTRRAQLLPMDVQRGI